MNKTAITFDKFKKYIQAIKDIEDFQDDIMNASASYCKAQNGEEADFRFPTLECELIDLLETVLGDKAGDISYWVFELNFGRMYEDGCVKDKDGTDIPFRTVEDLWNYVTKDNPKTAPEQE